MDWDDLRYFQKVAETGGLSPAARFLKVNAATVGRHVEALEAQLGQKLFERTYQGYRTTEAGERLLRWAQRVQGEFAEIQAAFAGRADAVAGTVSIATTEPLAAYFLIPGLAELALRHPGIEVEIATDVAPVNLSRREADVALRLVRPTQGNLLARRIGEVGYALYASPGYLAAQGMPAPGAFAGHRLIDWPVGHDRMAQAAWLREIAAGAAVVLRSTSGVSRMAAATAGLGVALLPCLMVGPAAGLRRIDLLPSPPSMELWVASHGDLAHLPRVRAVLDHLTGLAAREAHRLAGSVQWVARSGRPGEDREKPASEGKRS